jgi:hypothetical protein
MSGGASGGGGRNGAAGGGAAAAVPVSRYPPAVLYRTYGTDEEAGDIVTRIISAIGGTASITIDEVPPVEGEASTHMLRLKIHLNEKDPAVRPALRSAIEVAISQGWAMATEEAEAKWSKCVRMNRGCQVRSLLTHMVDPSILPVTGLREGIYVGPRRSGPVTGPNRMFTHSPKVNRPLAAEPRVGTATPRAPGPHEYTGLIASAAAAGAAALVQAPPGADPSTYTEEAYAAASATIAEVLRAGGIAEENIGAMSRTVMGYISRKRLAGGARRTRRQRRRQRRSRRHR